ncbi:PREDICTED: exosome complex component RRP45A isoform X1 [Theobroma cacao]|uniref:Protein ECERIFERUM 7 n=1 Tax=Theobroma cacao TaxID=3641 RepID=A0AB32V5A4_THECC|nr:PREDICTED: exosome complex component RRP45A isoform X1 [Theobroma cacao]XP_017976068.1 PREDICTED: exosome complex component RRP45A isoform X1 [Theobroma cacao]
MDTKLANTWRLTVNEKNFIKTALLSEVRIDGRKPFEFRNIIINFGSEDGLAEVQLGQTRVMGVVTAKLVQPYQDRPNEGTLTIYTEFSPMADPSFETGRPGESAVELGRIVDRGLRESRAVDTESLCIVAGKLVWGIRIDLHILDNGGNLVDAANIAALAALMTFRRPECSLGGEDGQEVIIHPPEMIEPLPLIVHHLPIAITFGFFIDESIVVIDPTHNEEAVMAGRMIATVNANGDICAIQKAGGEGVSQSVIMQCLQLAITMAAAITKQIKEAVEAYNSKRALQKIKREPSCVGTNIKESQNQSLDNKGVELAGQYMERLKLVSRESCIGQSNDDEADSKLSALRSGTDVNGINFIGGPFSWDPYSKGVDPEFLKASLASKGLSTPNKKKGSSSDEKPGEAEREEPYKDVNPKLSAVDASETEMQTKGQKTLKDAVKPKNKRKKKGSSMI